MMRDHHLREHHVLSVVSGHGRGAGPHAVAAHVMARLFAATAAGGEREGGDRDDEQGVCAFQRVFHRFPSSDVLIEAS
jgi:hypothetical protein